MTLEEVEDTLVRLQSKPGVLSTLVVTGSLFSCPGSSIPDLGDWVGQCHFRILTQRVTFETSDPSDI